MLHTETIKCWLLLSEKKTSSFVPRVNANNNVNREIFILGITTRYAVPKYPLLFLNSEKYIPFLQSSHNTEDCYKKLFFSVDFIIKVYSEIILEAITTYFSSNSLLHIFVWLYRITWCFLFYSNTSKQISTFFLATHQQITSPFPSYIIGPFLSIHTSLKPPLHLRCQPYDESFWTYQQPTQNIVYSLTAFFSALQYRLSHILLSNNRMYVMPLTRIHARKALSSLQITNTYSN